MRLSDFEYNLPPGLIAQYPCQKRDESRLLLLHKDTGAIEHLLFRDIVRFFKKGDILALNDTKVYKARVIGRRRGHTGKIEFLVAGRLEGGLYNVLARPSRKLSKGTRIVFDKTDISAEVIGRSAGYIQMRFEPEEGIYSALDKIGSMPLPPYIKRNAELIDESRYQTVYAKKPGAIAAPTAGLHFTNELIDCIRQSGVNIAYLTLHVGYGTFRPVTEEDITRHHMHHEYYEISEETARMINNAKVCRGRVIAAGTTACRALESACAGRKAGQSASGFSLPASSGSTDIFIYPGYGFKAIDMLLTNFHLPRTTLLMLVCAFAGREMIMKAYNEAIKLGYRFFSYGDAMLIV
ncbi:MAG: tRNA preQ1(34) S-adenosylmethionine ribosyltransferase-isomerase QueA [Candidatus Omnitrophica bacterium]|nr:tRNA preQ1(34) S-adenosylmethionine ribosyltransferase-isomerase QueA [Candidatus Omnitrophota bacterium]